MIFSKSTRVIPGCAARLLILGCSVSLAPGCGQDRQHAHDAKSAAAKGEDAHDHGAGNSAKIEAARAKLSAEDRRLVEAQEFCVIQTKQRLGSMGTPVKLDIQGQPVFLCCKACTRKATADPEKTLKTLDELKAKVKAEASVD
jgi:hypothetical protein